MHGRFRIIGCSRVCFAIRISVPSLLSCRDKKVQIFNHFWSCLVVLFAFCPWLELYANSAWSSRNGRADNNNNNNNNPFRARTKRNNPETWDRSKKATETEQPKACNNSIISRSRSRLPLNLVEKLSAIINHWAPSSFGTPVCIGLGLASICGYFLRPPSVPLIWSARFLSF